MSREHSSIVWEITTGFLVVGAIIGGFWLWPQYQKESHEVLVKSGIVELQKSHFTEATQSLKKAVEQKSDDVMARLALANSLYSQGKMEEALQIYQSFDQTKSNEFARQSLLNMASIYEVKGEMSKALAALSKLESLDTNSALATYKMGSLYLTEGKKDLAEKYFKKTLSLQPQHELALFQLARLEKEKSVPSPVVEMAMTSHSAKPKLVSVKPAVVNKSGSKELKKQRAPANSSKVTNKTDLSHSKKEKPKKKN